MPIFRRDDRRPAPSAPVAPGVVRERPVPRRAAAATRIGPAIVVVGRLSGAGPVEVAGRVEGTVAVDGTLVVAAGGSVAGDAGGREVRVEGRVEGRVIAAERAVVAESGRVMGDVEAPRVVIAEGAYLEGRVRMGGTGRGSAAAAGEST
jgi:cytoskeletal protein CcmA (bactofilin family)